MLHASGLFVDQSPRSDVQQAVTPLRTTFTDYKGNTEIANKRRDTATKKIDKLVEEHLSSPNCHNALHKLNTEAPQYLERLQRSSPMRHALVSSQLNLIISQAIAFGVGRRASR